MALAIKGTPALLELLTVAASSSLRMLTLLNPQMAEMSAKRSLSYLRGVGWKRERGGKERERGGKERERGGKGRGEGRKGRGRGRGEGSGRREGRGRSFTKHC